MVSSIKSNIKCSKVLNYWHFNCYLQSQSQHQKEEERESNVQTVDVVGSLRHHNPTRVFRENVQCSQMRLESLEVTTGDQQHGTNTANQLQVCSSFFHPGNGNYKTLQVELFVNLKNAAL